MFFVDLVIHNELKSYEQKSKAGNHLHAQSNHACSERDLVSSASLPRIMWIDSKVLRILACGFLKLQVMANQRAGPNCQLLILSF